MSLDFIHGNSSSPQGTGSVANRLLANGMDTRALRTNSTLMKDEWIQLDEAIVREARERLRGVSDLMNNNLTLQVNNALGTLVVQHHQASEMVPAKVSMDGLDRNDNDRVTFNLKSTPLPIIHSDFQINARHLEASRRMGQTIDTTQAEEATRQVTEKIEDMLFNGLSKEDLLGFGDDTAQLHGYTNFPQRGTFSISEKWDTSAASGSDILSDVLEMIRKAHQQNHFGPYRLYIPTNYWVKLLDDFKADSDKSIIQRLREIPDIQDVVPADKLEDDNVVLVQMTRSVIDMVVGFQPQIVEWEGQGGMVNYYKIIAVMVPRPKATLNGNTGIIHGS